MAYYQNVALAYLIDFLSSYFQRFKGGVRYGGDTKTIFDDKRFVVFGKLALIVSEYAWVCFSVCMCY